MKLSHAQLQNGIWTAQLTDSPQRPALDLRIGDQKLQSFDLTELPGGKGNWDLKVELPGSLISDDTGLLTVIDLASGNVIGMLQISAGQPQPDDLAAEVARLRQELEVVKEVIRKHLRNGS